MAELPQMVQALLKPAAYPVPMGEIKLAQTQMSFVFVGGQYVYKIKKPVNLGYLDYTTLEQRLFFCRKELELNRRLCPDTYLEVVSVNRCGDRYAVNGEGDIVEWAVMMRRLPTDRMMDRLLVGDGVTEEMTARLAVKLADFHCRAETGGEINSFGSLEAITRNTEENFNQTEKYVGRAISKKLYDRIAGYTRSFLASSVPLFQKRMEEGHIRDCHGDLHAAHVCFADGICVFDCIEFNDRFRYGDNASEVAFLAMDIDRQGRADLAASFVNAYVSASGDAGLKELLPFYKCYRAYVRGKVACFKLDDPYVSEAERRKALEDATAYFELAYSYTLPGPVLFITVGLVGCGKSTLAGALAGRLGLVVISSDVTRKRLADVPQAEHRFEEFDSGIYSSGFTRWTYDAMFERAGELLSKGVSVVLDASFIKSAERLRAKSLAGEKGARFFVLECRLGDDLTRQRLAERLAKGSVSDGRWEIFLAQKKTFEPVAEISEANRVIIDSAEPLDKSIGLVVDKVGQGS
jgi:uncharacterized protein